MHRTITLPHPPQRIISLVPSQTELLFDLGLGNRVVGITKFCIHPAEAVATKIKVGGTKKLNFDTIRHLNPDLIIGNKEENEQGQMERLMRENPVWMSDIVDLPSAMDMMKKIGQVTQTASVATKLLNDIEQGFAELKFRSSYRTAYFIWRKPYMVAGGSTYIDDIMARCGFVNVFKEKIRYPELTVDDLQTANPQLILLSSEPYPFRDKHMEELRSNCPNAIVVLVDGEMFSWYGSRLLKALAYFQSVINSLAISIL